MRRHWRVSIYGLTTGSFIRWCQRFSTNSYEDGRSSQKRYNVCINSIRGALLNLAKTTHFFLQTVTFQTPSGSPTVSCWGFMTFHKLLPSYLPSPMNVWTSEVVLQQLQFWDWHFKTESTITSFPLVPTWLLWFKLIQIFMDLKVEL